MHLISLCFKCEQSAAKIYITILTSTSVCPSACSSCVRHKKLTSLNQKSLLINLVPYAEVMKNITLASPLDTHGAPSGVCRVNQSYYLTKVVRYISVMKKITTALRSDTCHSLGGALRSFTKVHSF